MDWQLLDLTQVMEWENNSIALLTSLITSKPKNFIKMDRNNKAVGFMKEGHIFTIEPMIN
jgi:methionine aminopeptidase